MTQIAILGFGVVGSGVAELITSNQKEVSALASDSVNIKYILDLRDFPDSEFADKIIHDFSIIENDGEISTVIEVMGGSNPAYEYTVRALKKKKNVITSNKEVVARFGDEFLALAKEMDVSYRFEAAVGGGIPVISPLISCIKQNKLKEIRGILNGTTNYILTKMFTFGDNFENALADAQARGYAEKNPDADIHGTDACRKIAILTALATGKLIATDEIPVEGITGIRPEDVSAAEKIGCQIKLLGRCIISDEGDVSVSVSPTLIPSDKLLASVSGVFNAIEVIGDPIGEVMFYGPGAGAGPTASAVVGDLMQIICTGAHAAAPVFVKQSQSKSFAASLRSQHYIAAVGACEKCVEAAFGKVATLGAGKETAFITSEITDAELELCLEKLRSNGAQIVSNIKIMQ